MKERLGRDFRYWSFFFTKWFWRTLQKSFQRAESGMDPIVGTRYKQRGRDYDLCEDEYQKLSVRHVLNMSQTFPRNSLEFLRTRPGQRPGHVPDTSPFI